MVISVPAVPDAVADPMRGVLDSLYLNPHEEKSEQVALFDSFRRSQHRRRPVSDVVGYLNPKSSLTILGQLDQ